MDSMKITVIWTELSGYITACLKEFQSESEADLLVISNLGNKPNRSFQVPFQMLDFIVLSLAN